jgi:lipoprotein NlpI/transglutaminase-like putative cysteine protease
MGFGRTARTGSVGAWLILAAWPLAASAQQPPNATHPKAGKGAHAPGNAASSAAAFTIARTPAWVQPLAYDASIPVPAAPYQFLFTEQQIRVQDGGSTRYQHTLRQINDTSALQQGGQIEIDFDPSYQRLVFHKIEILRGTLRIDKLDAKKIRLLQREQQLERQMIDGRITASIVLDDLRAGDRVEWSASLIGDNPVFGGRFVASDWDAYSNAPIGVWRMRVLAPAARDIRTRVGDPATTTVTSSVHDGVRETIFKRVSVPQAQSDDHLPPAEYLKWQVDLSEYADWKDVAAWAAQLFARAMQSSPAVDAQVAALKAKAADRDALLRATLDFVQRDIRYFGSESHQPATADTVLHQRFGDCKDKVALLAELLARMGFEATPVIVSAQYQDATSQRLPSPLAFDHAIVRVIVDGKPVFLDATRSQQTGTVAARESRDLGLGLLARDGVDALTPLPSGRDTVRTETIDTFSFPKLNEEGSMTSVTTLHGEPAEWFRLLQASQPQADIDRAVSAEIVRAYPSLTISGPIEFETATEDNTVKITSHFRTGDFWTLPEQRWLVGRYALFGLAVPLRLPDQATRTQPYRIASPGRYLHHTSVVFGEPFPGAPVSTHIDETNDVFDLHVRFEAQSPREDAYGELRLLADTVAPADWQAHRDKLNKSWPKLSGNFVVSPLSVEQQAALRTEGDALLAKLRRGDMLTTTQVQAAAYLRMLALDKELDSDRLPPPLRAQVLAAKGVQLDHLGKLDAAKGAFEASLLLDPASAETHGALAENAMYRGDDAMMLKEVGETLRLAPSRTDPYKTRGIAHYLAGDMAAASADFVSALQARDEIEHSYGAIWLYLATRRGGGDGVRAVKAYEPTAPYPEWPYGVLQLMEGRIGFAAALEASRENGQRSLNRECELYFFAGEKALADGDLATARKYLRLSVATGVTEFVEYQAARRELVRIGEK